MSFLSSFLGPLIGAAGSVANIVAPGVGSAVAGVVGDAISSGFNQMNDNAAIDKYNYGQLELAKYVADRNEGFWNLQNEYNTPKKQMQRYIDAGLNPNLIYGQINNGNASAVQAFSMPSQERRRYKATVNAALGLQLQNSAADTKVKEAQANRLNADADLIRSRKTGQDFKNQMDELLTGEAKIRFETLFNDDQIDLTKTSIYDKEVMTPIYQKKILHEKMRVAQISAAVADYFYKHGQHEQQLQALNLLNGIRKAEKEIKEQMASWAKMGINPNTDGFIVRQVGLLLEQNGYTSLSEALTDILSKVDIKIF